MEAHRAQVGAVELLAQLTSESPGDRPRMYPGTWPTVYPGTRSVVSAGGGVVASFVAVECVVWLVGRAPVRARY